MLKMYDDRIFPEVDAVKTVNQPFLGDPLNPGLGFVPQFLTCSFHPIHQIPPGLVNADASDCSGSGLILVRPCSIGPFVTHAGVRPKEGWPEVKYESGTSRSVRFTFSAPP